MEQVARSDAVQERRAADANVSDPILPILFIRFLQFATLCYLPTSQVSW